MQLYASIYRDIAIHRHPEVDAKLHQLFAIDSTINIFLVIVIIIIIIIIIGSQKPILQSL